MAVRLVKTERNVEPNTFIMVVGVSQKRSDHGGGLIAGASTAQAGANDKSEA